MKHDYSVFQTKMSIFNFFIITLILISSFLIVQLTWPTLFIGTGILLLVVVLRSIKRIVIRRFKSKVYKQLTAFVHDTLEEANELREGFRIIDAEKLNFVLKVFQTVSDETKTYMLDTIAIMVRGTKINVEFFQSDVDELFDEIFGPRLINRT